MNRNGVIIVPKGVDPRTIIFDRDFDFRIDVMDGLKSIDTNLNLILKALTKTKKKKKHG